MSISPKIFFRSAKRLAQKQVSVLLHLILITAVMAQVLAMPLIKLSYDLNKDFIAQTFCENRDKPELDCCGKCYLEKELVASQEDSSPASDLAKKPVATRELFWLLAGDEPQPVTATGIIYYAVLPPPVSAGVPADLLRPPSL